MKKGFTIIEILVAIGFIGIISTIGIASFNTFNEKSKVKKAREELTTYLRMAANKAQNNEKDSNVCCGTDKDCATFIEGEDLSLDGWYIDLDPDGKKLYGQCGGVKFGEVQNILSGFTISASPSLIQFKPLGQGTNLASDLTITISKAGKTVSLIVDPSGNVTD